ncbi:MAG: hypothetical protein RXN92_04100 [Thermoplasmatales archaeon]
MDLSDQDIYRIRNSLDLSYNSKIKILKSLEELKTEGFLKKSDEIENFLNACYGSVKYKEKLNIMDILELSDSDFQEFIRIYKSKEKEIGFSIKNGQVYIKGLKNKRSHLLIFNILYSALLLFLLPFKFVFHPKNWLIYDSIIIIPWLLSLVYIIILSMHIHKSNRKLLIKYNNREYIPPLKLDITKIEWIKNEVNYDFPMFVKNVIDYVMSLPNTVKCSVCGGTGKVERPIIYEYDEETYGGNVERKREVIGYKDVECKHCGGVGYFYIQGTKDIIKAHGYELINYFNNFLNMHPNLKDEIQRFNLKIQIYISRLRLINDNFYS